MKFNKDYDERITELECANKQHWKLHKDMDELRDTVKELRKQNNILIDTLLMSNQNYLFNSAKQYIKDNYDKFKYSFSIDKELRSGFFAVVNEKPVETTIYTDENICIKRRHCEGEHLALSFYMSDGSNGTWQQDLFSVVYKNNDISDAIRCEELFKLVKELYKEK